MKKEAHCHGYSVRSILQGWINDIDSERVFGLLKNNEYLITIEDYKLKRSIAQNKLMWLWIELISKDSGESKKYIHKFINTDFIEQEFNEVMGKVINTSKTTSELNTKEFSVMLNEFERHMNEFQGWLLPRPDDLYDYAVHGAKRK